MGVSHNFFFLEEGVGVVKNVQGKCLTVELISMDKVMLNASWCVFFFLSLQDRVLLYSFGDCPGTHSEDQTGLKS